MTGRNRVLNAVGGLPDLILVNFPDPSIRKSTLDRETYLRQLAFYDPDAWDPGRKPFFYLPDEPPASEVIETEPFGEGRRDLIRYPSRYEPRNPEVAGRFNRRPENLAGYLHLWCHCDSADRPLVLMIHGLMMGGPEKAQRMFKVDRLFGLGLDVALYTLPGHWRRSDFPLFQRLLDPADLPLTAERMAQNVHDLHSALMLLRSLGYENVGMIGASMGGFTAAQYATQVTGGPDFMFLVVPGVSMERYLEPGRSRFGFPVDSELVRATERTQELFSPLYMKPLYDVDRIRVVAHAGDRLCPAEDTRRWIESWGIEDFIEVVGGHWLHLDRKARGNAWYGLLRERGYIRE
ncbi:MAG: alpha/beta hydrolase [Actinobacteria bacterium]|nr:alpha/beta hydrolase [Actinomycetota bacterium]MBU1943281.1 alpha/beta hydrolase [Actinomycetota bacterium]MBU2688970.1 alpha/beta hydrolase [Actinomycetota bacterium]